MEILLQQGNLHLDRRPGRTRRKLQRNQAWQHVDETVGRELVQQGRGVGYPLRFGSRRASFVEVQGQRHGLGEQV